MYEVDIVVTCHDCINFVLSPSGIPDVIRLMGKIYRFQINLRTGKIFEGRYWVILGANVGCIISQMKSVAVTELLMWVTWLNIKFSRPMSHNHWPAPKICPLYPMSHPQPNRFKCYSIHFSECKPYFWHKPWLEPSQARARPKPCTLALAWKKQSQGQEKPGQSQASTSLIWSCPLRLN